MTGYKQRHPAPANGVRRQVSIVLPLDDWRVLEREAENNDDSVAHTISVLLSGLSETRRHMLAERAARQRPGVYYSSSGEELEHADVAS